MTELVRHKQVDAALRAARTAKKKVVVVGRGPDARRLESLYSDVATFAGRLSDEDLAQTYARAQALIVPNIEEFGIAAVEAQAAGRPVIGVAAGGTAETVIDGQTGALVPPANEEAMAEVLRYQDFTDYSSAACKQNAERFSVRSFRNNVDLVLKSLRVR